MKMSSSTTAAGGNVGLFPPLNLVQPWATNVRISHLDNWDIRGSD